MGEIYVGEYMSSLEQEYVKQPHMAVLKTRMTTGVDEQGN